MFTDMRISSEAGNSFRNYVTRQGVSLISSYCAVADGPGRTTRTHSQCPHGLILASTHRRRDTMYFQRPAVTGYVDVPEVL